MPCMLAAGHLQCSPCALAIISQSCEVCNSVPELLGFIMQSHHDLPELLRLGL
jgi:hypothetical protein